MTTLFFPYSWHNIEDEQDGTYIRTYGLGGNNETICIHFYDFTPYVYLELPLYIHENNIGCIKDKLNSLLGIKRPIEYKLVYTKKLY